MKHSELNISTAKAAAATTKMWASQLKPFHRPSLLAARMRTSSKPQLPPLRQLPPVPPAAAPPLEPAEFDAGGNYPGTLPIKM